MGAKIEKHKIKMIICDKIETGKTSDMKRQIKILKENHEINSTQFFKVSNIGSITFDLIINKLNKKKSPIDHNKSKEVSPDGRKLRIFVIWIKLIIR
jgi:hypothetical protein